MANISAQRSRTGLRSPGSFQKYSLETFKPQLLCTATFCLAVTGLSPAIAASPDQTEQAALVGKPRASSPTNKALVRVAAAKNTDPTEEIMVKAKSGTQAVRHVSGSETVLTGAKLNALGAQSLEDYLTLVPGVIFNANTPGEAPATIRGVATTTDLDQGQSATGYFINDIPLNDPLFTVGIPDIDAFDVADVAVLRGPQGTLFGSSSLGGAINYQAAMPNLEKYEVHLQGTGEWPDHSSATGGSTKAMVNIPIIKDVLAVRAVYVYKQIPGYIDNNGTGERDSNGTVVDGGRFEATWKPTSSTTFNYFFLDQVENTNDVGYSNPSTEGRYSKSSLFPETSDYETRINNLRLDQNLGFAVLTATATYHQKYATILNDLTSLGAPYFGSAGSPYEVGSPLEKSEGVTFEARLASDPNDRLAYVAGFYHDSTTETLPDDIISLNPTGFASSVDSLYGSYLGDSQIAEHTSPNGVAYNSVTTGTGRETAVFGEATYHLTNTIKLNFGGRYFWTTVNSSTSSSGIYELLTTGETQSNYFGSEFNRGFTPKGSITWTPNRDFMLYGLISEGYRFGGPNVTPPDATFAVPKSFGSDSLTNYEVGIRTNMLDRKLQFDATGFYIDWNNIQLRLTDPDGFEYGANAGKARNVGGEFTTSIFPLRGLRIENNVTYLSATLGQDFSPGDGEAVVSKGSTLPGASKWNVSTTASYSVPDLYGSPVFAATQRYISTAPGSFGQDVKQGGYVQFDLRATIHVPRKNIDITAFIDNIGDTRGVTYAERTSLFGYRQYLIQPRTFGLTLDYRM